MPEHLRTGTEVLDGLRGLAILLVLAFHTWLFSWFTPQLSIFGYAIPVDIVPRTGYLGVELFFVISGFVLFFPHAVRAISGAGATHDVREFTLRRVAKIVPSYALAFIATCLSMTSMHQGFALWPAAWQHALFVNNFFDDRLGYANSVFWSLAIEAQFYVVFPAIAVLFRRHPIVVPLALTATALYYRHAVAACCILWEPMYRQLPAFLDVFAAGMFGAYALVWIRTHRQDTRVQRIWATLTACAALGAGWTLLAGANAVAYDIAGAQRWDVINRTVFALDIAVFAVASSLALPLWRAIVANRILIFLSLISYNLYLWHTLVMIRLWRGDALPHITKDAHADGHWKFVFIAISWPLAIAIATAITYFFERPILSLISPQRFAFRWRARGAMPPRRSIASAGKRT